MMTNPPSYTLLNVRAGRSQGILTVMGRLDLNLDQLYSSAMLQVWFGKTAGKVSTILSATSSSWVGASVLEIVPTFPRPRVETCTCVLVIWLLDCLLVEEKPEIIYWKTPQAYHLLVHTSSGFVLHIPCWSILFSLSHTIFFATHSNSALVFTFAAARPCSWGC